jgi:hypothetical protein
LLCYRRVVWFLVPLVGFFDYLCYRCPWELAQKIFGFGQCDIRDFYADVFGALIGVVLVLLFFP